MSPIPSAEECRMIAAGLLNENVKANNMHRTGNPEWAKARALTASAYLTLADQQPDFMTALDDAMDVGG